MAVTNHSSALPEEGKSLILNCEVEFKNRISILVLLCATFSRETEQNKNKNTKLLRDTRGNELVVAN